MRSGVPHITYYLFLAKLAAEHIQTLCDTIALMNSVLVPLPQDPLLLVKVSAEIARDPTPGTVANAVAAMHQMQSAQSLAYTGTGTLLQAIWQLHLQLLL